MKTKVLEDFQICISVPFIKAFNKCLIKKSLIVPYKDILKNEHCVRMKVKEKIKKYKMHKV